MTVAYPSNVPASSPRSAAFAAHYLAVPGRVLMSVIFLMSGFGKIVNFSNMTGYMVSKGAPAPKAMLAIATAAELLGGLSLLLGLWSRVGAIGLFLFLIPTTLMFHNFWAVPAGPEHMDAQAHFMKNVAIMGGLLMVAAFGPGPLSIDDSRSHSGATDRVRS
jgi:putative oxidoreductase